MAYTTADKNNTYNDTGEYEDNKNKTKLNLNHILESVNLAEDLNDEELQVMADELLEGIESDINSRSAWEKQIHEWTRLAAQVKEEKSYPWTNAANIKYPLVTIASTQFAARSYPALVSSTSPAKGVIIGADPTGEKNKRAIRLSKHMSYQIIHQIDDWEEGMDRLLHLLPVVGTVFKKIYYSPVLSKCVTEVVPAIDLIINYSAPSVLKAQRKTHRLYFDGNDLEEYTRMGLFLRHDDLLPADRAAKSLKNHDITQGMSRPGDERVNIHHIYECHCFWDLDGDGYREPYIVTIHKDSRKILRIYRNFEQEDVLVKKDTGEIVRITPCAYFIPWVFIPDPNSNIYGLGFGHLLGPINETINTLINQLLDAGTLNNLGGGWLGKNLQLRSSSTQFDPGEWKVVNSYGDDLRKGIVPLPQVQPSGVLFNLLGLIESSGMKVAGVVDILTGDIPGQNTKATVAMAAIEQGLKVFSSIYKRGHRALTKELKLYYKLNSRYLAPEEYWSIVEEKPVEGQAPTDYIIGDNDVMPGSDSNVSSEQQRLAKVQALLEILQLDSVNPAVVTKRYLEATEQPNIEELMEMPPPPGPPLEMQLKFAEQQHKMAMDIWDRKLASMDMDIKAFTAKMNGILSVAKAEAAEQGTQLKAHEVFINTIREEEDKLQYRRKELLEQYMAYQQQNAMAQQAPPPEEGQGQQ